MSTRTHHHSCAKTEALRKWTKGESLKLNTRDVECTCSAEFRPGIEERLEHAEHDRRTLEKLENAFEAVGGDLVDEVMAMKEAGAEVS